MAKIIINDILASFASTTSINSRFQQIQDELNNKVLYRDNPIGEPNKMTSDLDMDGNALLNVSVINIPIDDGSGVATIADGVSWSKEWAIKTEDALVSIAAGGDNLTDYSSLHHAAKADEQRILSESAKTAAELAETNTEAVYEIFDDRYLGSKSSAPTTLNDGTTALGSSHEGIEYWNSSSKDRWTWTGAAWILTSGAAATTASSVNITDSGSLFTGTNVEDALQELANTVIEVGPLTRTLAISSTTLTATPTTSSSVDIGSVQVGDIVEFQLVVAGQKGSTDGSVRITMDTSLTGTTKVKVNGFSGSSINIASIYCDASLPMGHTNMFIGECTAAHSTAPFTLDISSRGSDLTSATVYISTRILRKL